MGCMIFLYISVILVLYVLYNRIRVYWRLSKVYERAKFPTMKFNNMKNIRACYLEVECIQKQHEQNGKIFKLWCFDSINIFLPDPKDVEALLMNKNYLEKSFGYKRLVPILGSGLITSKGEIWHKHRTVIDKCFTYNSLRQYGESMRSIANDILADVKNLLQEDGDIDILLSIHKWMGFNLYRTVIGTEMIDSRKFFSAIKRIGKINTNTYELLRILPSFLFRYTKHGKEVSEALLMLKTTTEKIIADKKEALKKNDGIPKLTSLTDLLVSSNELSFSEIRDEIQTFIVSGLETTTITVAYCIYALSRHPEIQDKLYKELITQTVPGKVPSLEDLNKLKYLTCVLKETMRAYTAISLIGRHISQDLTLPSGHILPAGCDVNVDLYTIHHNPEVFKEPDQFIPERFEDKNVMINSSFIPFGAGTRMCIGYKFAMMEMKLILALLIKEFQFLPSDTKLEITRRFLLAPVKGVPIKLKSR